MRTLFLIAVLISACLPEDEASIMQSGDAKGHDLTNPSSPSYIEQGECLIDIESELALGKEVNELSGGSCLPSSRLSWLFRAQQQEETKKIGVAKPLQLAVLFDTSYSLRERDPEGKRYEALKTYLLAVFDKKKDGEIESATIRIFPFKYCDQGGNHTLTIDDSRIALGKDAFSTWLDSNLIGTEYTNNSHKSKIGKYDEDAKLTDYGAVGSTNYLHSLAKTIDFFDVDADALRHVVIISDGLPFTFNDGTNNGNNKTVDLFVEGCNTDLTLNNKETCLVDNNIHYPSVSCQRPLTTDLGFTDTGGTSMRAWNDPLNHILGMAQHIKSINERKEKKFEVYAAYLRPDKCDDIKDEDERNICEKIPVSLAESFFKMFTTGFEPVSDIDKLADALKRMLENQTSPLAYKKHGKAFIKASKGTQIKVDNQTTHHKGNRIKVGRDGVSGAGKGATGETVYDYINDAQNTLIVEHGLQGRHSDNFTIPYDFTFRSADACRSKSYSSTTKGNLEVNRYDGTGYTAWCLLPPRCNAKTQCCDPNNPYQVVNEQAQQGICQNKGKYWQWVGPGTCACKCDVDGKGENTCKNKGGYWQWIGDDTCDCICNDTAGRAACQGKNGNWSSQTCTCEENKVVIDKPECTYSTATYCCKEGKKSRQPTCKGQTLDINTCSCVDVQPHPQPQPPTPPACNPKTECCTKTGKVMQPKRCPEHQRWEGHDTCDCVCKITNCNTQENNWTGFPTCSCTPKKVTDPKQPPIGPTAPPIDKNGKVTGEDDAKPAAAEGIVWGEYESF